MLFIAAGCGFPDDQSTGMFVAVEAPAPVLIRGGVTDLTARVWSRLPGGDSTEVRNAELLWSTSDPQLATISAAGGTTGRVTGVNPGIVEVRAFAPGYEAAEAGIFHLRVANPLEIDSVSPDTVRYGELLTAYGVGVGSLFFAQLGNQTLAIDSLAVAGDPHGLGARAFWVAFPASSGQLIAAGSGQLIAAPEPTVVLPWDIYEPNQTSPWIIPLDGPPPYPEAPALRLYNPALAFEDLRGAAFGYDWYRLTTASPSTAVTMFHIGPALRGTNITYLTHDAAAGAETSPSAWRYGPGVYDCKGHQFRPAVAPSDTFIVALGRLPAGSIDLISAYAQQGRYAMAVFDGYGTLDTRIGPDRFEENDICHFADENFADPAMRIDLATPFSERLTIDNPNEIDWLRVRVPGSLASFVTVRTAAWSLGGGDRSDIDVYVLRVPDGSSGLDVMGGSDAPGSSSSTTLLLSPGDYYVAVVDSAGVPTHYGICIAMGSSCTLPTAPAAAPSIGAAPPPAPLSPGVRPRAALPSGPVLPRQRR